MTCYLCAVDGSPASAGPNNIALCKWVGQDPIVDEQKGSMLRKRDEERGRGRESSPCGEKLDHEHPTRERFREPGMELTRNRSIDFNWNSLLCTRMEF